MTRPAAPVDATITSLHYVRGTSYEYVVEYRYEGKALTYSGKTSNMYTALRAHGFDCDRADYQKHDVCIECRFDHAQHAIKEIYAPHQFTIHKLTNRDAVYHAPTMPSPRKPLAAWIAVTLVMGVLVIVTRQWRQM